jgi:hypothetical protein
MKINFFFLFAMIMIAQLSCLGLRSEKHNPTSLNADHHNSHHSTGDHTAHSQEEAKSASHSHIEKSSRSKIALISISK